MALLGRLSAARYRTVAGGATSFFAAVLAIVVLAAHPIAMGAAGWCRSDPSFVIEDHIVHVDVASLEQIFQSTTGPIKVKLKVPQGIRAGVFHVDNGFGFGYDIEIIKVDKWDDPGPNDSMRMEVHVLVPASDRLPVLVSVFDDNGWSVEKLGETKDWIRIRTKI